MKMNFSDFKLDKSTWVPALLGDLAKEVSSRVDNPSESKYDKFVGLQHFASGDLKIKGYGTTDDLTSSTKAFEAGDVLLARRNAYLRRASLVEFDGVCSGDAFVLRENHERIVPGLLAFIVNSSALWDYANANAAGTMSKRVKWRDLANYEFLLPPKAQQTKIMELFWTMDEVIDNELMVLENTNRLLESIYKKFRQSTEDWSKHKIKDLMSFNYGKGLKESDRIDGDYPVVSSSGIQGTHNSYFCDGPGIVVGRKGNVGDVTWVDKNFWAIDTAYYISINQNYSDIPLKFFYYLLKSANLKKHSIATAVPGLNRDDAVLTSVYLPSKSEIGSYLLYFETVSNQILNIERKIDTSRNLMKSLINQVF